MLRRDDAPFKTLVDQTTAKLYASPEMTTLYDKWFTNPVPPHSLNLKLPISPVPRQSLQAAHRQPRPRPLRELSQPPPLP